ncbi:MAG: hypothetical protein AAGG51_26005 [Cyanobacteria bacterium P01_G01_bin.54]
MTTTQSTTQTTAQLIQPIDPNTLAQNGDSPTALILASGVFIYLSLKALTHLIQAMSNAVPKP